MEQEKLPPSKLWQPHLSPATSLPAVNPNSALLEIALPVQPHMPIPPMPYPPSALSTFRIPRHSAAATKEETGQAAASAAASAAAAAATAPPSTEATDRERAASLVDQQSYIMKQQLYNKLNWLASDRTQQAMILADTAVAVAAKEDERRESHRRAMEAVDEAHRLREKKNQERLIGLHAQQLFQQTHQPRFTKFWKPPLRNSYPIIQSRDSPSAPLRKSRLLPDVVLLSGNGAKGLILSNLTSTYNIEVGNPISIQLNFWTRVGDQVLLTLISADANYKDAPQPCKEGPGHGIAHLHHQNNNPDMFNLLHGAGQTSYNFTDGTGTRSWLLDMTTEALDTVVVIFNCSSLASAYGGNGNFFLTLQTRISRENSAFAIPIRLDNPSNQAVNLVTYQGGPAKNRKPYTKPVDKTATGSGKPAPGIPMRNPNGLASWQKIYTDMGYKKTKSYQDTLRLDIMKKVNNLEAPELRRLHNQLYAPAPPPASSEPPPPYVEALKSSVLWNAPAQKPRLSITRVINLPTSTVTLPEPAATPSTSDLHGHYHIKKSDYPLLSLSNSSKR